MLTVATAIKTVERITYKPGWTIRAETGRYADQIDVLIEVTVPDSAQPGQQLRLSARRLFDLTIITTPTHLVHVLFHLVSSAERHEIMEFFKVDGKPLFDPHKEIAA